MAKKIMAPLMFILGILAITISMGHIAMADAKDSETAQSSGRVIKVAYVESENFIREVDGTYGGYCVDYLDEIGTNGNWTYKYIAGTWDQCISWVEDGTVDMACMVQRTEEREEKFLFSDESIGDEYGLIYALDESDLYYQDYALMDGMDIAMLPNTVFDGRLDELEDMYNIKLQRKYYGTIKEVILAMETKRADLAMIGSIFGYDGAKVVGRDDGVPYYCVMSKDNQELMAEFNEAHRLTLLNDPGIQSRLYQRYYQDTNISSGPLFTRDEHKFIEQSDKITVKMVRLTHPLCYKKNGEYQGIYVEYLKLLAEKSGLNIVIECDEEGWKEAQMQELVEPNHLILRSSRVLEHEGLEEGYISSNTLVGTSLACVKRTAEYAQSKDDYVFALTKDMEYYLPDLLNRNSQKYKIEYFADAEACLQAVVDGEADVAIQDEYVVSYLMQKPKFSNKLIEVSGIPVNNGMSLISTESDRIVIDILNKTIDYMTAEEKENIVTYVLKTDTYRYTLDDVLYEYWGWLAIIIFIAVAGLSVYIILNRKLTDMKVQKTEYEILQRKVQRDEVSGAYNKHYFYELARKLIDSSEKPMCIAMMDITNFKVLNDLYGLEGGDKLLRYIATELKKIVRKYDGIVARFNADHFYMCMEEEAFTKENFPKRFKKTVLDEVDVSVTYGVYAIGEQKDVPVNIMCDRASMANHDMTHRIAGFIQYYSDEDRARIVKQKEIEGDMENALEQHQFCVFVQPKYDVFNQEIIGGEALARWKHPDKGMISPGDFIPIFEKNGFIRYLDYYIWEETCKVLSDLKEKNAKSYPVSINVSRAHFYSNELADKLMELLNKYGLEPSDLELEITETIYAEDSESINKRIKALQDMGFKIAMDDFGSGYSSLNMLKEIPLDIIKMDLRFLDSKENVEKSHKILGTLVELAKNLDLNVVVEGVETEEQVEFLKGLGDIYAQGFYFSRPVDSETYENMVISNVS